METMTPLLAIGGGFLIGTAAALLLLLTGRIAGVSGMVATATRMGAGGTPWSMSWFRTMFARSFARRSASGTFALP